MPIKSIKSYFDETGYLFATETTSRKFDSITFFLAHSTVIESSELSMILNKCCSPSFVNNG